MTDDTVLAMDFGGSNLRAGLVARDGTVIQSRTYRVPPGVAERATLPDAVLHDWPGAEALGLAIAGTVRDGVLLWTANLGLHDVPFARRLGDRVPTRLVNDARAAGYAEARSVTGGHGTVLTLTIGTGIGGALVVDGALIEGTGSAGEVGHIVVDPDGPPCACGRSGCWERLAGGRALAEAAALTRWGDIAELDAAARRGDSDASAWVGHRARLFARGIGDLCAVLAPHHVILGGGIMARDGAIAGAYRDAVAGAPWFDGEVRRSTLGDQAGLIGAGLLAWDLLDGAVAPT